MSDPRPKDDEQIKYDTQPVDARAVSGKLFVSITGRDKKLGARNRDMDEGEAYDTQLHIPSDDARTNTAGFMPDEFLPEDFPEIDPRYLDPNLVSATALPRNQTGIPESQWVPAEVYREHSNASIYEPQSVVGESGRLYHGYKEGKYLLPNDAAEQERLDLQHKGFTVLLGDRLYLAPIGEPKRVLDIGTGTGIWALDFAREHPQAHVIGADLSKIQPDDALPNVEFVRDDVEDPWVFDHRFDFIHSRLNFSCFDNPKGVMEQAFQFLEPGGWIEYLDASSETVSMDDSAAGTMIQKWGQLLSQGLSNRGRDPLVAKKYKDWLRDIGFVDIVERKMVGPHGGWPKKPRIKLVGRYFERVVYGVGGISFGMLRAAGMSADEITGFVDQVRVDLLNPHIHTYWPIRCVYGRKPFDGEAAGSS